VEAIKLILSPLITLIVGGLAYLVYRLQRRDYKRDVARAILQEIRWAENIINDYKEHQDYKFTKKIIATNSWAKNMHLFVGDLTIDEIDRISDLYSTGEYLDCIINKVSDITFDKNTEQFFKILEGPGQVIFQQAPTGDHSSTPHAPQLTQPVVIMPPWKFLLDEISLRYEAIYHSTVVDQLKKFAKV
jgi:hypothetical protein